MAKTHGHIIIEAGAHPRSHEIRTAKALNAAGHTVRFLAKTEIEGETCADILMDGVVWEMKAPKSNSMKSVQRNMRKALKQSRNLIVDSRRIKEIPSDAIEHEVRTRATKFRSLQKLIFVNKFGEVLVIK